MNEEVDLTIIGAGPVGMFAGFYAGLRELKVAIVESLSDLGGQVTNFYPNKTILDVAGFTNVSGQALIDDLSEQLSQFDQTMRLGVTVTDIIPDEDGYQIQTDQKDVFHTKGIVLATGAGAFEPRRISGDLLDEQVEENIHYSIHELESFAGKRVLVAGGGDSAVDMALHLEPMAAEVRLTHRRDKFRALEHSLTRLENSSVTLETPYTIKHIARDVSGALSVTLQVARAEETKVITVDEIVVSYGFQTENKIMAGWTIKPELNDQNQILVSQNMATSVKNVYAIGDVAAYNGKYDVIATGFGEAPTAINDLMTHILPEKKGPAHSTALTVENGTVK
ncbi:NAD(P)/FAD-dependent oxidoreductase [Weissella paramesenteroides]|uniref:NAD(P)/FAD-dependent oxidoreductase n=1 Tax=Weissella paramesenteroides TaxID=1249 RepID=UPI00223BE3A8|nr:NAD(P)/FAD-dependent oxidoreductase [Weissella paramesenteroides]MCT0484540.1 NAD(P)/FAD-dependent oxidoreductase [Weissella paramesenteroides]